MKRRSFRHQVELLLLAVDNRPGQGVSYQRVLARVNLRFAALLSLAITVAAVLATIGDYAASLVAWLDALVCWLVSRSLRLGLWWWQSGWGDDLALMRRAVQGPWTWRVIYGE